MVIVRMLCCVHWLGDRWQGSVQASCQSVVRTGHTGPEPAVLMNLSEFQDSWHQTFLRLHHLSGHIRDHAKQDLFLLTVPVLNLNSNPLWASLRNTLHNTMIVMMNLPMRYQIPCHVTVAGLDTCHTWLRDVSWAEMRRGMVSFPGQPWSRSTAVNTTWTRCVLAPWSMTGQNTGHISWYLVLYCFRYILTAGHCVHYCRDGILPNCSNPIPVSQISFKVSDRYRKC